MDQVTPTPWWMIRGMDAQGEDVPPAPPPEEPPLAGLARLLQMLQPRGQNPMEP